MLQVIADAINQLADLRADPQHWTRCEYRELVTEEWERIDANNRERYRFLIALQYGHECDDESLLRYLFEQEVIARQQDDYQGFGPELRTAAYLLSMYRRPEDFWRFAEAKFANFDTYCGFEPQFLLSSGVDSAVGAFGESNHPLKERVREIFFDETGNCRYTESDLIAWEASLRNEFPKDPAEEPAKVWVTRAIELNCRDEGKVLLENWESSQCDESLSTLCYLWDQLGEFKRAIVKRRLILQFATTAWDRMSAVLSLVELHLKDRDPTCAWTLIEKNTAELTQIDRWNEVGLGRFFVKAAFEAAVAIGDQPLAQRAFAWACHHESQLESSTLEILELAARAAESLGDRMQQQKFRHAAEIEQSRIHGMIGSGQ